MFKKTTAVILAIVLVLGLVPATAFAVEYKPSLASTAVPDSAEPQGTTAGGLVYQVYATHVEITGYTGTASELVIPAEIEELPVTVIGWHAFEYCYELTSITFPHSIAYIHGDAFSFCSNLASIQVDGENTVYCSVNGILYNKEMTELIFFPAGKQGNVVIPDGVTSIRDYAIHGCDYLSSVSIPGSVSYIGVSNFLRCDSLTGIYVDHSNTEYSSDESGCLFNKDKTVLIHAPGAISGAYSIPDSVVSIQESAFFFCKSLSSVSIPDSVVSIGEHAFYSCSSLSSITIPDSISILSENIFGSCDSLRSVSIPDSVISIGKDAFYNCSSLRSVTIPDSVTSIGDGAFSYCYQLRSVTIPDSVASIGGSAFAHCVSLNNVTIPEGISVISNGTFYSCSNLDSMTLPDGVISIGEGAFYSCSNLRSVTIPDSVTHIGASAFYSCISLTDVTIPNGVTTIEEGTFYECLSLTRITIPDSVTTIEAEAFGSCEGLINVSIGDGVVSIGEEAFYYCCNMTDLTLGRSVSTIGRLAFGLCHSLRNFTIPDSVTSIGDYAFYNCNKMTRLVIPSGVTHIEQAAFGMCGNLAEIRVDDNNPNYSSDSSGALLNKEQTILIQVPGGIAGAYVVPESVAVIGLEAFGFCSKLTDVLFRSSAPSFDSSAFHYVTATAYYPEGNATWTTDVMQNYGGTITWIPYDPGDFEIPDPTEPTDPADPTPIIDTHDTLEELTTEDYLAFSAISYLELSSNGTLEECMVKAGYWDDTWHEGFGITYETLCRYIKNWKRSTTYNLSSYNGFYAVTFTNDDGEAVIAYRGSVPPPQWGKMTWDAYFDWLVNDLPIELGNSMGPQLDQAIDIYNLVASDRDSSRIVVTGHSLGGAWADTVSAYSGCRGVSFNAISILDVLYKHDPERMSRMFDGADHWNFVDHTNKNDILAGMFEHYFSTEMKPYVAHRGNIIVDVDALGLIVGSVAGALVAGPGGVIVGGIAGTVADEIAACHGMESLVIVDAEGNVAMTGVDSRFVPSQKITNYMLTKNHSVDLGTSRADTVSEALTVLVPRTSYGGGGDDIINTSIRSDTIIGGPDHSADQLDGSWGDDTYIYHIGDGYDKIWDVSGKDTLEIFGAPSSAKIDTVVNDETDMVDIYCDGELIVSIYSKNRQNGDNSFTIRCGGAETSVTANLRAVNYSTSLRVSCPVHVEVLDTEGNVVHTLTDGEVGSWYTDYGNFYVFEEENGEYGKVLDLIEGYTARIVGADAGTMDVTYQVPLDGALSEPVSVSDVPVTDSLTAFVEEDEDGKAYLVIDEDGDGTTDTSCRLYGENPFTDVPADSFYFEPVMWAVEKGITNGLTPTEFGPNATCNRAQVVTFLWRAAGSPEPASAVNPFVDVQAGSFYEKPVLWAVEKGITNGADATHFNPGGICNRAQVVTFLFRAFGAPAVSTEGLPFTDVPADSWYASPVAWAVENGITNGLSATEFGPNASCNRAQVVTFLYRAYNK